jgi:hypothetical protein
LCWILFELGHADGVVGVDGLHGLLFNLELILDLNMEPNVNYSSLKNLGEVLHLLSQNGGLVGAGEVWVYAHLPCWSELRLKPIPHHHPPNLWACLRLADSQISVVFRLGLGCMRGESEVLTSRADERQPLPRVHLFPNGINETPKYRAPSNRAVIQS